MPKKPIEKEVEEEAEEVAEEVTEEVKKPPIQEEIESHDTEPAWVKSIRDLIAGNTASTNARFEALEKRIPAVAEEKKEVKEDAKDIQEPKDNSGGGAGKTHSGDGGGEKPKSKSSRVKLWRVF